MKKIILPFLLVIMFGNVKAQKDTATRSTVTVVYSKVKYKSDADDKDKLHTLVKINPLLLLNGDIPIYVERRINDQLSIEGSLGVTYKDFIYEYIWLEEEDSYNEDRLYNFGYSLSGAVKFYPDEVLDGTYFGVEVRHRRYNSKVPIDGAGLRAKYEAEYRNLTDFKFTIGYVDYLSKNVIVDYYAGVGLRSRNNRSVSYVDNYSNSITSPSYTPDLTFDDVVDVVPTISAGIKIGFGL